LRLLDHQVRALAIEVGEALLRARVHHREAEDIAIERDAAVDV